MIQVGDKIHIVGNPTTYTVKKTSETTVTVNIKKVPTEVPIENIVAV